jgi:hypothetical protein
MGEVYRAGTGVILFHTDLVLLWERCRTAGDGWMVLDAQVAGKAGSHDGGDGFCPAPRAETRPAQVRSP